MKNRGQSTVEYILLLAVIASIALTFFQSQVVTDFFGEEGLFTSSYKKKIEYSYRYAMPGQDNLGDVNPSNLDHSSYYSNGDTRFFGSLDAYDGK